MTKQEVVEAIAQTNMVHLPQSVREELSEPGGRKPWPVQMRLSKWYNKLSPKDRERVHELIRDVAMCATFNVMSLLDGNWRIDEFEEPGTLRLTISDGTTEYWLNNPDEEDLHDIFQGLCPPGGPEEFELDANTSSDDESGEPNG
jgi:hypothetical protein